jgi:hypothetical protein
MSYFFDLEDFQTTCRAYGDYLFKQMGGQVDTNKEIYYETYGTYDGYVPTQETLFFNSDGSISMFLKDVYSRTDNSYKEFNFGSYCCENRMSFVVTRAKQTFGLFSDIDLNTVKFVWDNDKQTCRWKPISDKECNEVVNTYKIALNPVGDDGALFNIEKNDNNCSLNIDFSYLFKFDCDAMAKTLAAPNVDPKTIQNKKNKEKELAEVISKCETITELLEKKKEEFNNAFYSITLSTSEGSGGFDGSSTTYCIDEENDGLVQLEAILGPLNFKKFIEGDENLIIDANTSYTLLNLNNQVSNKTNRPLFFECDIPYGTKSQLKHDIDKLLAESRACEEEQQKLRFEISQIKIETTPLEKCSKPIYALETLDISMTLDVIESDGSITTVTELTLFPEIGVGNLYDYLIEKQNESGIYFCGIPKSTETWTSGCTSLIAQELTYPNGLTNTEPNLNVSTCNTIKNSLLTDLLYESPFGLTDVEKKAFYATLDKKVFASNWLNFNKTIEDETIINKIKNKKIKVSVKVNNSCNFVCVYIDNIKLNKECVNGESKTVLLSKSPSFEIEKVIDNKKSWVYNTTRVNRNFEIENLDNLTIFRKTGYDVNDERLIINTKEIDLKINAAAAIENDVWCYINDNKDLLNIYTDFCQEEIVFSCPSGYIASPSNDSCYSASTINASFSGTMFTAYTGNKVTSYNKFGTRFYENIDNFTYPLTLPSSTVTDSSGVTVSVQSLVNSGNSFWSNNALNYSHGRLNDAGVWGTYLANPSGGGTNYPTFEWVGFTVCIDIPEPKVYYLGLASDNRLRFKINGELIVNFNQVNTDNFYYLHVFPINIPSGPTIIEVEGYNDGSQAAFVAEIYDPTNLETLTASTSTGTTGLIFSTKQMIGQEFLLSTTNGYSCPAGYSLNNCSGGTPVCTSIGRSVILATSGTTTSCGDGCVAYSSLTSTNLSTVEDAYVFREVVSTELIDVKNRKIVESYGTARGLYDRYLNSVDYNGIQSSEYDYDKMDSLTQKIGSNWVDVIEQLVPATTIWGSVKVYGNTIFDQQKFKYKKGTTFTCINNKCNLGYVDFINNCMGSIIDKFYSDECPSEATLSSTYYYGDE